MGEVKIKYETREEWLHAAINVFRSWFADTDTPLPEDLRISVGWVKPARNNSKKRTIGWCFRKSAAADEISQVFISPELDNPVEILSTTLHELCHAATDGDGHGAKFRKIALAVGLTGKMTETVAGENLAKELADLAKDLGPFPHAKLTRTMSTKGKHGRYQTKLECSLCGFDIPSVSRKKLDEFGMPEHCGEDMVEPE